VSAPGSGVLPAGVARGRAHALVEAIRLDLRGLSVLTEAATGGYRVTAGLAALAGARVVAVAGDSAYGTADEAAAATRAFARTLGVEGCIEVVGEKSPALLAGADVVTNSGHVRPIDRLSIAAMKATAVVPLMYETWERRPADLDLAACVEKGIAVAGTDEEHPEVGILRYLGVMAAKLLLDHGVEIVGSRIALWSDNKFAGFIAPVLAGLGAEVLVAADDDVELPWADGVRRVCALADLPGALAGFADADAVLLALTPGAPPMIGREGRAPVAAAALAAVAPGAVVAQYWGDVERDAVAAAGLRAVPAREPRPKHMGVLPSELGLTPMLRLQAGGLKVGELMARARLAGATPEEAVSAAVAAGFGQRLA